MDWCHCIEEQFRVTLAPWISNVLEGHSEGIHWGFCNFYLALLIGGCEGRFWDYGMPDVVLLFLSCRVGSLES